MGKLKIIIEGGGSCIFNEGGTILLDSGFLQHCPIL